ncbi:uncharacterized protein LOC126471338 [Schistocerca serialis cubense]|uniref:uncharacterized protein LOC126471338 n=1 Tax=Schistocerca serialis cubense TaxID=2023355 RepID=UPI00214ED08A|nr:uncharacterized protein LOC126471338 [Schistocerca serialis cubense]
MTRDQYLTIRSNLKVTDDNAVTEETRRKDKLWKIRPLLECVKRAGKPNPEGLKNFVLAAPSGLVLDFEIYHGKGTFPDAIGQQLKQGIGASAVLRLCQSLPEGTQVFFDRILRAVHLTADKTLANQGCGSVDQTVRKDKHISIVKWYVQKLVITASTKVGKNPMDQCKRWSKKDRRYIQVPCPAIWELQIAGFSTEVTELRTMSQRRIFCSTLVSKLEFLKNDEPKKNILQYLDFKIGIAEHLLRGQEEQHSDEDDEE